MLDNTWAEIEYGRDFLRATDGAHLEVDLSFKYFSYNLIYRNNKKKNINIYVVILYHLIGFYLTTLYTPYRTLWTPTHIRL